VGLALVSPPLIYAQESAVLKKVADVLLDRKFGARISRVAKPEDHFQELGRFTLTQSISRAERLEGVSHYE
jgi:hypothetical protein